MFCCTAYDPQCTTLVTWFVAAAAAAVAVASIYLHLSLHLARTIESVRVSPCICVRIPAPMIHIQFQSSVAMWSTVGHICFETLNSKDLNVRRPNRPRHESNVWRTPGHVLYCPAHCCCCWTTVLMYVWEWLEFARTRFAVPRTGDLLFQFQKNWANDLLRSTTH